MSWKTFAHLRVGKNILHPRSYFDKQSYHDLLVKAGLNVDSIEEEKMTYTYDSEKKLKGYLTASIPQVKKIPIELKAKFISDVSKEFIKTVGMDDEGNIPLSYWCLNIIAHKPPLAHRKTFEHSSEK